MVIDTGYSNRESNRGFTLIEVIIFLVVAGVIASAIFIPFLTSLKGGMTPEKVISASYLAQEKMEKLTKYTYNDSNLDFLPLTAYVQVDAIYFPDYDWRWEIKYIDEDLNDSVCDVGYKQILVRVRDPDGVEPFDEVTLTSIVTGWP